MKKITKPGLINFFMHLCKDMNKAICLSPADLKAVKKWRNDPDNLPCEVVPYGTVGAWYLDYAGCYGGWQIQEICTKSGGIDCPLGHCRHTTKQMFSMICFAREALRLKKMEKVNG